MLSKNCLLHTLAVVPPVFQVACARAPIDSVRRRRQDTAAAFNQAAGFSSPNATRQTSRRYSLSGGVIASAFPCCTFSYGEQGNGRLYACWKRVVQSANPFLLFPALTFSSVKRGLKNQHEKVLIIMKSIRKGYSRPITAQPLRTFPTLLQASAFVDRLTAQSVVSYRFNIQQTAADCWTVARVVSGGAA